MDHLNLTTANFTNISTSEDPLPSFSWGFQAVAPAVLLSLCFLAGVLGNLAVMILKPNWQNLSRPTQSLMMNLAWSDLLCLVTLPFGIYNMLFSWTLGTVMCKIVPFSTFCSIYNSLLTVTALSVQRYLQVTHQQRCQQLQRRMLLLLWLASMALSTPTLVFCQVQDSSCSQMFTSREQHVAVLLTECFVIFSSFTVITCSYCFMNRRLNQAVFFNNASTSRLLTSIIVTFFVLWMPYLFFNLVSVGGLLTENWKIIHFHHLAFNFFISVTFINSCMNPLLYAFALGICRKNLNVSSSSRELTSVTDA